jgi:hypothetical protein
MSLPVMEMQDHFGEVSLLGPSLWAFLLVLAVDLTLTLVHTSLELKGRLWRHFGAIEGVYLPDVAGFVVFFLALTVILWALGFAGIAGTVPFVGLVGTEVAMAALGVIIGGRLSDGIFSHVLLDRKGYRPNPALSTIPYYFAEAGILAVLFSPGLLNHSLFAAVGFLLGGLFFVLVRPSLRLLRLIQPPREPWKPNEEMPEWARS